MSRIRQIGHLLQAAGSPMVFKKIGESSMFRERMLWNNLSEWVFARIQINDFKILISKFWEFFFKVIKFLAHWIEKLMYLSLTSSNSHWNLLMILICIGFNKADVWYWKLGNCIVISLMPVKFDCSVLELILHTRILLGVAPNIMPTIVFTALVRLQIKLKAILLLQLLACICTL